VSESEGRVYQARTTGGNTEAFGGLYISTYITVLVISIWLRTLPPPCLKKP